MSVCVCIMFVTHLCRSARMDASRETVLDVSHVLRTLET